MHSNWASAGLSEAAVKRDRESAAANLEHCCRVLPEARGRRWIELTVEEQRAYVMRLLDALEVTDRDKRLKVARAILYLAQGKQAWDTAASRQQGRYSYSSVFHATVQFSCELHVCCC